MPKFDFATAICRSSKNFGKPLRAMMRVHEKPLDAEIDQVIERESNERFVKNRHERLRQVVRQRAQPRPEAGAQDECLCDCSHRVNTFPWQKRSAGAGSP